MTDRWLTCGWEMFKRLPTSVWKVSDRLLTGHRQVTERLLTGDGKVTDWLLKGNWQWLTFEWKVPVTKKWQNGIPVPFSHLSKHFSDM